MPRHSDFAFTPYDGSHPLFRIGLRPFDPRSRFRSDQTFNDQMREKRRLLREKPDHVFQAIDGTYDAQAEILALVREAVIAGNCEQMADGLAEVDWQGGMPDLLRAALMVQEDLVIMSKRDGYWHLAAGCVCFPSSWYLPEKIGKPMHGVHGPVPGFHKGTRNAGLIERIFDNLQKDQPVERFNWSVYKDDQLFHGDRSGEQLEAGDRHFLRVERQTLTRLPMSGDILFTIRIYVDPMDALANRVDKTEIVEGFIELLQALDADQLAYKGLTQGRERLIGQLKAL